MRMVLSIVGGMLKVSFVVAIVLWTIMMNFIGLLICAITSQN